ncbi:hypothetical protein ABTM89_19660, partial [Acinetobacter baumannii]
MRFIGSQLVRDWHRARFRAGLRIVSVDHIDNDGTSVIIDGAITSNRLRASRIRQIKGRVVFQFKQGKIVRASYALHHSTS